MQRIIVITGPTSSGKSDLAIWLAKKLRGIPMRMALSSEALCEGGEVISADSRQVYKGMDLGTGKVPRNRISKSKFLISNEIPDAQASIRHWKLGIGYYSEGIRHHCIDIASPRKNFSLGQWLAHAKRAIAGITRRGKVPIVCGGTLLYVKALLEGWTLPAAKPDYFLRRKLERLPATELYAQLQKKDPARARAIDPKNKRRLVRALEILSQQKEVGALSKRLAYQPLVLVLGIADSKLESAIERRLKARVTQGIVAEIGKLTKRISIGRVKRFGLEYDWFGRVASGEISEKEAFAGCLREIIRFAKRQTRDARNLPGATLVQTKKEALLKVERFLAEKPRTLKK